MTGRHMAEPWVSVDDVAKHLGVVKDSVYRWIERKGLREDRQRMKMSSRANVASSFTVVSLVQLSLPCASSREYAERMVA